MNTCYWSLVSGIDSVHCLSALKKASGTGIAWYHAKWCHVIAILEFMVAAIIYIYIYIYISGNSMLSVQLDDDDDDDI